jgi:uncharacterized membrane protein
LRAPPTNPTRFGRGSPRGFDTEVEARRYRRIGHALRRRRRLRLGLVQLIFIAIAFGLALLMPEIDVGSDVDNVRVSSLFFSLAGGLIALVALVFSLLFLVVPYANTSLTPRLTLFRDDPVVWRAFAFFVAVLVFLSVSGIVLSNDSEVSFLVPAIAVVLVLAALGVVRTLQFRAYRTLQLGATLIDITAEGTRVLHVLYGDQLRDDPPVHDELPAVELEVRWPHSLCVLQQIDLPKLLRFAQDADALVEVRLAVGEELRRDRVVFAIRGSHGAIDHGELLGMVATGPDRAFDQDPLFAFRLLVDIALRAVSSAVNDPITAVQAIAGVHELLHVLVDRDLDIGRVGGTDDALRVVLKVPTWEDYLAIGVDELTPYIAPFPQVRLRLAEMVDALAAEAPPSRQVALESRRREILALAPPLRAPDALSQSPSAHV